MAWLVAGSTVLMSTTSVPRRQPAKTPSGPSSTAASAGGSATMVTTTSAPTAASRGVATTVAPSGFSASAFAAVRFCARTAYPAFRTFLTIRPPMMPNPTKATVCPMTSLLGPRRPDAPVYRFSHSTGFEVVRAFSIA